MLLKLKRRESTHGKDFNNLLWILHTFRGTISTLDGRAPGLPARCFSSKARGCERVPEQPRPFPPSPSHWAPQSAVCPPCSRLRGEDARSGRPPGPSIVPSAADGAIALKRPQSSARQPGEARQGRGEQRGAKMTAKPLLCPGVHKRVQSPRQRISQTSTQYFTCPLLNLII